MMGDGTQEHNLDEPGKPEARITQDEVDDAFGKQPGEPPPAWMVRGFEAAIADRPGQMGAIESDFSGWLLRAIPTDERSEVIDKLLPLLGSTNSTAQQSAALALAAIPLGDRAGMVID